MLQIEAAALSREIGSPLTSARRREQATDLRDAALTESSALQSELNALPTNSPTSPATKPSRAATDRWQWRGSSQARRDDSHKVFGPTVCLLPSEHDASTGFNNLQHLYSPKRSNDL